MSGSTKSPDQAEERPPPLHAWRLAEAAFDPSIWKSSVQPAAFDDPGSRAIVQRPLRWDSRIAENDDGSDSALWLQYERETADILFLDKLQDGDSILTPVFGEKVAIGRFSVTSADIRGKRVAATTISLRDIVLADGFPVY